MKIEYRIYQLVDPTNNQIRYVGLTLNTLNQRLKSHRNENSKSHKTNWVKSLQKKGYSPKIELIEIVSTYEEACEREIYWISKLKEEGHRLTNHASGGNKNKKMSDEVRLKMSIAQKERYKNKKVFLSNEVKKKISESTKKRMQKDSERERLRISNKKYEDSKTEEQKINDILKQEHRIIVQYDRNMNYISEYISIRDAMKRTNINRANISKCCQLKVATAGGYVWRYKGDDTPLKEDKRANKKSKSVIQYNMNMNIINEFLSIKQASEITGVSNSGIYSCCIGKFSHSGGFIWRYKT